MLIHFSKQPINSSIDYIAELATEPTDLIIQAINERNTYANEVKLIDKQIAGLNNLEGYIAECRKLYGNDYRKQDFDQALQERPDKLAELETKRPQLVKLSVTYPQILSINALQSIEGLSTSLTIQSLCKSILAPLKDQIEAGISQSLAKILVKQFGSLTLIEVGHCLNKFVNGEIKIYSKLNINDITVCIQTYLREKQAINEAEAEDQHQQLRQARSQGELTQAIRDTKERLQKSERIMEGHYQRAIDYTRGLIDSQMENK